MSMHLLESCRGLQSENGQSMVEYALILVVFVIGGLIVFSNGVSVSVTQMFDRIAASVEGAVSSMPP